MNNISSCKIISPVTKDEWDMYFDLRFEILRKPWGQDKTTVKDEWEDISFHALMIDETGKGIATGRLQFNSDEEVQVRSMAVADEYQGKGIGSAVLKYLEKIAAEKGMKRIILDAREGAVSFYLKNGYAVEGDSYVLFGVIPHFRMVKMLD